VPLTGLDYLAPVRSFRNFFGRYGTTRGSIRGIWNGLIPVAVVDRYRDDTEGSVFGITWPSSTPASMLPAFAFGSPTDDWELLQINVGEFNSAAGASEQFHYMLYTPDSTYIPVQNAAPALIGTPGLNNDFAFTLGSVTAIGGWNPAVLPARDGYVFSANTVRGPAFLFGIGWRSPTTFDPPIRVYRDVTLGVIGRNISLSSRNPWVSILYRIRPRTTDGPRTGTP